MSSPVQYEPNVFVVVGKTIYTLSELYMSKVMIYDAVGAAEARRAQSQGRQPSVVEVGLESHCGEQQSQRAKTDRCSPNSRGSQLFRAVV